MGAHLCRLCGHVRARSGDDICPVCWLVRELKREHRAGEHTTLNPSCVTCTRGRYNRPVRRTAAGTIDHSTCNHPITPRDRAKCRAQKAAARLDLDD